MSHLNSKTHEPNKAKISEVKQSTGREKKVHDSDFPNVAYLWQIYVNDNKTKTVLKFYVISVNGRSM